MSIKVKAVWVGGVQVNGLVKKCLSTRNMQSVKIRHSDISYLEVGILSVAILQTGQGPKNKSSVLQLNKTMYDRLIAFIVLIQCSC